MRQSIKNRSKKCLSHDDCVEIELSRGKSAHVNESDFLLISFRRWHAAFIKGLWYAQSTVRLAPGSGPGKTTTLRMHGIILGTSSLVDHRNGDGLDNRRENIRLADLQINAQNRHRVVSKSGFMGVKFRDNCPNRPWIAYIQINGKSRRLGQFATPELASAAYQEARAVRNQP